MTVQAASPAIPVGGATHRRVILAIAGNHLIALLPRNDRNRLIDLARPVDLTLSAVLYETDAPARNVYFPTEGFVSLVSRVDDHPGVEVGMVGREGMLGLPLALGVAMSPLRAIVQGEGVALRIPAAAFRRALATSAALKQRLDRYTYVRMTQLATSAACLRFHLIGPRLARWLLMSHDRAGADRFRVTHEFLAYMLGVRRVGITVAAGSLQRAGLIEYHRGELAVLDRAGLEAASCSCYAADGRVYDTLMNP